MMKKEKWYKDIRFWIIGIVLLLALIGWLGWSSSNTERELKINELQRSMLLETKTIAEMKEYVIKRDMLDKETDFFGVALLSIAVLGGIGLMLHGPVLVKVNIENPEYETDYKIDNDKKNKKKQ